MYSFHEHLVSYSPSKILYKKQNSIRAKYKTSVYHEIILFRLTELFMLFHYLAFFISIIRDFLLLSVYVHVCCIASLLLKSVLS